MRILPLLLADAQVGFVLLPHEDGQVQIHISLCTVVPVLPQVGDLRSFISDEVIAQHMLQLIGRAQVHKQRTALAHAQKRRTEEIRQLAGVLEVVQAVIGA